MKTITIQKLANAINATLPRNADLTKTISGVSIDSRTIKPGDAFFAVTGENFDGHNYIDQAFAKGASCAVTSRKLKNSKSNTILKVRDTIKALGELANNYRNQSNFKVVAITGSAGKTTTRQIAAHVLSRHFDCHQSEKNFNNNIGLPLTILSAPDNCRIAVTELGTSKPGEIAALSRIAEPDIAIITNIYPAHIEGLKSIEGIIAEKSSIAGALKPGGKFIINAAFPSLMDHCKNTHPDFITFGTTGNCDINIENATSSGTSSALTIEGTQVTVPLPGQGNIENASAAWAICKQFDITPQQFARAMETLPAVTMRMEIKKVGSVTVINDCYNANPASMQNAIQCLSQNAARRNKRSVFICGSMAELADHCDFHHTELGQTIAASEIDLLLTAGPHANTIAKAAKSSPDNNIIVSAFADTDQLCQNLNYFLHPDDIILVKGSRDARLEAAVEMISHLFT